MLSASTLDQTYNGSGIVLNDFNTNGTGSGAAIQADDKVVVGGGDVNANPGTVQIDIERYTTQGVLDPNFGTNGQFTLARGDDSEVHAIAIDSSGNIIATGTTDSALFVLRLTPGGALDTTFGDPDPSQPGGHSGIIDLPIFSSQQDVTTRSDGTILVTGDGGGSGVNPDGSGFTDSFLAQITPQGALDPNFAGGTGVRLIAINNDFTAHSIGLRPDGSVIVGGTTNDINTGASEVALAAFDTQGTPVSDFGTLGFVQSNFNLEDQLSDLAIRPDGSIDAATNHFDPTLNNVPSVYHYNSMGIFQSESDLTDPSISPAAGFGITIDSAGRDLLTGAAASSTGGDDVLLARFDTAGNLDTTFTTSGFVTTPIDNADAGLNVLLQSDGRIIVAGITNTVNFIARYGDAPVVPPPPPPTTPVTIDANGNLLIPGTNGNDNLQVHAATGGVDVIYNGTDAGVFA
ncbi:MAG TPA: hypothetical protein VKK61_09705, partial [Tepidisphaeraceae bacterium]|nr:hypothetical protein [Tepidisphaeraceae bacterium]